MMQISFDLISDLHVDTWPEPFNWTGMATSVIAVVAGDVCRDRNMLVPTLEHLCQCYRTVLYIDGNDEHRYNLHALDESYKWLKDSLSRVQNLIFLHETIAVIDGIGFVGTNGWWTYDFHDVNTYDDTKKWFINQYKAEYQDACNVESAALKHVQYMCSSIKSLTRHKEVNQFVLVTHTPPKSELIDHDVSLSGTHMLNCSGNKHMHKVVEADTEIKINTWCFGHYHGDVDKEIQGIRYVNNCRGRGNTPWSKSVYYPKKIVIQT